MDFAGHPCFETHSDSVCHDAGASGDAGNLGLLYVLWFINHTSAWRCGS